MSVLKQISTHKAVKEGNVIKIYLRGLDLPAEVLEDGTAVPAFKTEDELLRTLPADREGDLFAIFENYEENNRVNLAMLNEGLGI